MTAFRTKRRTLLALAAVAGWQMARSAAAASELAHEGAVAQAAALHFPRDHGSHPQFNIEWWYVTGWTRSADERLFGFQITFFRSRVSAAQAMTSRFAAKQLLFAHAAVTDVQAGRLLHDQAIARAGFGVAEASTHDTAIRLRDWSLVRGEDGAYRTRIAADGFALELQFRPTQAIVLQGIGGLSRKGPLVDNVSHYYSQPQLAVAGRLRIGAQTHELREPSPHAATPTAQRAAQPSAQGAAWLDREWSDSYLHPDAAGWDWIGMNLSDGGALMAFRIRDHAGNDAFWDGGSYRSRDGELRIFERGQTRWLPLRRWTSAASRAVYPVEWELHTPVGNFRIAALVDNQELDSSGSTGAIYWEGLSDLLDAQSGALVGRGYLELTGYGRALRL